MRVRTSLLVVASPFLFAATCVSNDLHWAKPGATYADFGRDSYECAKET